MHQIIGKIVILRLSQNPEIMLNDSLSVPTEPNYDWSSFKKASGMTLL